MKRNGKNETNERTGGMNAKEIKLLARLETLEQLTRRIKAVFPWPSDYPDGSEEQNIMHAVYDYYDKHLDLDAAGNCEE
jgi:hypothetical protein